MFGVNLDLKILERASGFKEKFIVYMLFIFKIGY